MRPHPRIDGFDETPAREGQELAPGARGHMATYARALARACLSAGVQVVLSPTTPWPRQAISTGSPAPLAPDVVELVLPSDGVIVPTDRMPSPAARAAARAWGADRLLVVPALHGSEVLAVGLAPLVGDVRPDQQAVVAAGRRLAAALVAWRAERERVLVANPGAA